MLIPVPSSEYDHRSLERVSEEVYGGPGMYSYSHHLMRGAVILSSIVLEPDSGGAIGVLSISGNPYSANISINYDTPPVDCPRISYSYDMNPCVNNVDAVTDIEMKEAIERTVELVQEKTEKDILKQIEAVERRIKNEMTKNNSIAIGATAAAGIHDSVAIGSSPNSVIVGDYNIGEMDQRIEDLEEQFAREQFESEESEKEDTNTAPVQEIPKFELINLGRRVQIPMDSNTIKIAIWALSFGFVCVVTAICAALVLYKPL